MEYSKMQRLFVGLSIPADIRARLHLLKEDMAGARWTPLENYHITLAYIGEADETFEKDTRAALAAVSQEVFSLTLKGMGSFAQAEDADVLWAGVEKNAALSLLKEKICKALEERNVPFDKRPYAPHVTLARFRDANKESVARFMREQSAFMAGPFDVKSFMLYNSHVADNGPVYKELEAYPLMLPQIS